MSAIVGSYVIEELTDHLFQANNQFDGLGILALIIR